MSVPQMISSRRWSGFLRRLAVCVDEKCRLFEEGAAALLSDDCLGNMIGSNPSMCAAVPVCIANPQAVEPVFCTRHPSVPLKLDQEGKRKKQKAGCKISKKVGFLTGSSNHTAIRLPLTPTSTTENLNLNLGYLQALVGGLPTYTQADDSASEILIPPTFCNGQST